MACPDEQRFLDFLEGSLDREALEAFERHMDRCPECQAAVLALAREKLSLRPPEPGFTAADTRPARAGALSSLAQGTPLGRYVVLRKVGEGGMGVVYAAYDPELDRKIALKLLRADEKSSAQPDEARARLLREAQAMARLSHPNVVTVHDVGTFSGHVFIAMEYLAGGTLTRWLTGPGRTWQDVCDIFVRAGRGLAAAHEAGIVHRDFKPDNVLIAEDGGVRVTDFGLARQVGAASAPDAPPSPGAKPSPLAASLTRSGAVMGTPAYMAPEQHLGKPADVRTDQFNFSVALYEGLYGQRPFQGATVEEVARAVTGGEVSEPPRGSHVPGWLRKVILRGLSPDPGDRFDSMRSLLGALARDPAHGRRRLGALAAAVVVLLALFAVFYLPSASKASTCKDAGRKLHGIWDDQRRTAMRAAFEKTKAPAVDSTWRAVQGMLDRYAAAWVAMRTEACEATHVHGEQSEELMDLRMTCLDSRAEEFRAIGDVLLAADAAVVRRSTTAASALGGLSMCADAGALKARVKPPADPALRERVEDLRKKLARVKALFAAGKLPEADELATEAVAEARETGYRPVEAEALNYLGRIQDLAGKPKVAMETLWQATFAAQAGHHDDVAVYALAHLAFILGNRLQHWDQAHRAIDQAAAIVERLGKRPRLQAIVANNLGNLHGGQSQFEDAYKYHKRAVTLWEEIHGRGHPLVARGYGNLSIDARRIGKMDEALSYSKKAYDLMVENLGPEHPNVGIANDILAGVYQELQQPDKAIEHMKKALHIAEKNEGPDGPGVASMLRSIGIVLDDFGRPAEALPYYRRSLVVARKAYGDTHPQVAAAYNNVGHILQVQGKYAQALPLHEKSLQIYQETLGQDHTDAFMTLNNIGAALIHLERPAEALGYLDSAEKAYNTSRWRDKDLAELRFTQATARWALGERDKALGLAEKARLGYTKGGDRDREELGKVEAWIAERKRERNP